MCARREGVAYPLVYTKDGHVCRTAVGPFGITCNAIAPGLVLPDENARITKVIRAQPAEWQKDIVDKIPVGRTGTGEDIAELALYLASPASGFMTGQTLDIHGGVH